MKLRSVLRSGPSPSRPIALAALPDSAWTSIVPFALITLMIEGSIALPPGPSNLPPFLIGTALLLAMVGTMLLPWQHFPRWMTVIPSLVFVAGAALLVFSVGASDFGVLLVFIAPVLWTALYQDKWHSVLVVAGVVLAVAFISHSNQEAGLLTLRRVAFYGTISTLIAVATLSLRGRLRRALAQGEELLRQGTGLSQAAVRLNSLRSSDEVLAEACRLVAVMASPPGVLARRGAYLQLEGHSLNELWQFDESIGPSANSYPLSETPHLKRVVRSRLPAAGAYAAQGMPAALAAHLKELGLTHGAWIPVAPGGIMHGVLAVSSRGGPISSELFERAIAMGHILELALSNALTLERSEHDATTDVLTGLCNRRGFDQGSAQLRGRRPFAVLTLDVDGLKGVNDSRGHAVGDELIRGVGSAAASVMRTGDLLARVGGDEFAAFLGDCTEEGARLAARRILTTLARASIDKLVPRVSIGIACGDQSAELDLALEQADAAMYVAKRRGGSGFQVAGSAVDELAPVAGRTARS